MTEGENSAPAWLRPRAAGLRRRLVTLVLFSMVPLLLFAGALVYQFADSRREALRGRVAEIAESLVLVVDQEVSGANALLIGLATSPLLDDGRLREFQEQARRATVQHERWVILYNRDRDHLLNTGIPAGKPLPKAVHAPAVEAVLATGEPSVTGVFTGPDGSVVETAVPVVRGGETAYVLSLTFQADVFSRLLQAQGTPIDWTVAILDRDGQILARSRTPDRFVGQPAVSGLVEAMRRNREGALIVPSREGVRSYAHFKRSALSGWTVVVGVPAETMEAPVYRSLALLLGGGGLLLFLALALASSSARRIAIPVRQLARAAVAVGRGDVPEAPSPGIREVDEVGRVLVETAALLRQRQAERNQAEAALRASEGRLRQAHEAAGISDWEWDPSAGVMRWSQIRGKPITDQAIVDPQAEIFFGRVHPDDRARVAAEARELAEGRRSGLDTELRIVDPDGTVRWLAARGDVERDAAGQVVRVIGVSFDVTRRKHAEQALRESELRYRTLFEQAAVGVAHISADGRYLLVNQRFCDLLGYTLDELLGRSFPELTHPDDLEGDLEQIAALQAGRIDSFLREKRYRRKDGSYLWAAASVSLVRDDAGRQPYRIVVVQDISKRKEAERRQRMLVDELNHRVKNTLAAVQSLVMQSLRSSDDPKAFAAALQARIMALSTTHDLLTRGIWEGALLVEVAREALAPFTDPDSAGRFSIGGPPVHLAPNAAVALSMAFHELAMNALKYGALSRPEGRVALTWRIEERAEKQTVLIDWQESGGPPVTPPTRRGLGSRLIERGLAHELEAEVRIEFAETGVRCWMRLPVSELVKAA